MKAMIITPKNKSEFRFINELLNKLDISSSTLSEEDIEDAGLLKMLKVVDKTKKVSKENVIKKLNAN